MRRSFAGMPRAARQQIALEQAMRVQGRAMARVQDLLHEQGHQDDEAATAASAAIEAKRPDTYDVFILASAALLATRSVRAIHIPVAPRLARARERLRIVNDAAHRRKIAWLQERHTIDTATAEEANSEAKRKPVFGEGVGVRKRRRTKSAE